jgi:hypothetical protein
MMIMNIDDDEYSLKPSKTGYSRIIFGVYILTVLMREF